MKRVLPAVFGFVALLGCGRIDPIESVVRSESSNPYFPSGMFKPLRLPATATAEEVVCQIFSNRVALGSGELSGLTILTNRVVQISGESYTVALVRTSVGEHVVLVKYSQQSHGWWSRVYDN